MKLKKFVACVAIAALAVAATGLAGCTGSGSGAGSSSGTPAAFTGASLVGAGATFPAPVYQLWAKNFMGVEKDAKINYQAIGSGGGVQQFTAKTVDFGATDVPLKSAEASAITGTYIEFPTVLGAVVVSYNVPGVTQPLKLDGPTVANIFLGKVKTWDDPSIASQNPGVTLPKTPIQIVHRADASGTSGIFTGWLSAQSAEWKTKVGTGKSVQWPTGQGGNGNAGVAQAMTQTQGSIGYLEYQYAASTKLGIASIKASDGTYVAPTSDAVAKAGQDLSFPITESTNILDSKNAGAYPISSATYILIYTDQKDQAKAQTVVDFWTWALSKGQSQLAQVNYVPLPAKVVSDSLTELGKINVNGTAVKASAGIQ